MTPGVPHYDYGNADYVVEVPMAQDGGDPEMISGDPEMIFKDEYNTALTKEETIEYEAWVVSESKRQGRDIMWDLGTYDIQGFWKSGDHMKMDEDNHGSDKWKKPNHPTFSNQSNYHNVDGYIGGTWAEDGAYTPAAHTRKLYDNAYYKKLFDEPGRIEHLKLEEKQKGGSALPKAQDGTETKKVEEKSIWGLVKEMAKVPGANISNLLGVMGIPANLIAEATESLTGRGDGEFNFMDAIPSFATPGSDDEIFTFTNQNDTPVKNVAGLEDADGNPLVENPVGAFITNLATDPSTYVGAGVAKNVINKVTQGGLKRGLRKTIAKNIPRKVKTPIEGTDMVMTTNSKIGQLFDKTGIPKMLWPKGFNYGADEAGRSFVATANNASGDIIDLSKYADEAGDYFTFDNAFVKNPMTAGRSMKAMEKSIPKYGVIKQNPLQGSLSEDSFTMMLQRLKDGKRYKDVTNYGENVYLNRSGKNRIVKSGPTNQMLVNESLFDASEVAALNTKYGKVFDKLKNKGVLNDDFRGFGTREIKIPGLADKVYQVGVPNIGVQKLYQVGGEQPKAQDGNGEYKVASGDTFYGIANKNKIPWNALKEANPDLDYENLKLGQQLVLPNKIDRSPPMPKTGVSKNSNVLDYNALSNYLVDTRGGTVDTWGQLADTIAFHESSPWSRMDPKAKQYKGGPGRGLFQFEGESFDTALKRYKNVADAKGFTIKDSIVNAKSADQLSSEDQYTLFFANLLESKAKLSDYTSGNLSSVDVWLQGHKNVEAKGDRNSFLESKAAAEKEGIKNGYKTFQKGGEIENNIMYKNYIDGVYTGSKMESKAEKIYDKLNRLHYRDAKAKQMTPANYVLTHVIG